MTTISPITCHHYLPIYLPHHHLLYRICVPPTPTAYSPLDPPATIHHQLIPYQHIHLAFTSRSPAYIHTFIHTHARDLLSLTVTSPFFTTSTTHHSSSPTLLSPCLSPSQSPPSYSTSTATLSMLCLTKALSVKSNTSDTTQ